MSRFRKWALECKVYVGNLGNNAEKQELEAVFSKFGPTKDVWIARNPAGFAFVEFEDPRDAEDAVRGLDGTRVCGSRVRCEMSHGRSRRSGPSRRPPPPPPPRRYNNYEDRRFRSRSRSPHPRRRHSRSRSMTPRSISPSPRGHRSISRSFSPRERR